VWLSPQSKATLREIREEWTFDDLSKVNALLDQVEEIELALEGGMPEVPRQ
jgi:hypothetical protein